MIEVRPGYSDRVIRQTIKWTNGISEHNHIDNECCPDFSCCIPKLFKQNVEERIQYLREMLIKRNRNHE